MNTETFTTCPKEPFPNVLRIRYFSNPSLEDEDFFSNLSRNSCFSLSKTSA